MLLNLLTTALGLLPCTARDSVESLAFVQPALPILIGNPVHPVARLEVTMTSDAGGRSLRGLELQVKSDSTSLRVESVRVWRSQPEAADDFTAPDVFPAADLFGVAAVDDAGVCTVRGRAALEPGRNVFWLAVELGADSPSEGSLRVSCTTATLDDEAGDEVHVTPERPAPQEAARLGVRIRGGGDDGSQVYRIPALVRANSGVLVAAYDVRWNGWRDLPADIDVGVSRSLDGGSTWEPMQIAMDMGKSEEFQGDGVGDPALLVDRATGRIFLAAIWSHGNRGWNGSGPGLTPEETGQLMLAASDDDGATWSEPRSITPAVKDPAWSFLLQGPGRGITLENGTLVFPAQFQLSPDDGRTPCSTILWSADHGESWTVGEPAKLNTTEAAIVELDAGTLMLNMRDNRGGSRSIATSEDLGASWSEHPTSRSALAEPVCMASMIHRGRDWDRKPDGVLLFSNPSVSKKPRRDMTIRASLDGGESWPLERAVILDRGRSAGYSCLTMVSADTVGILYESSRAQLAFQRIPLEELVGQ